jgi:hypothetical protein
MGKQFECSPGGGDRGVTLGHDQRGLGMLGQPLHVYKNTSLMLAGACHANDWLTQHRLAPGNHLTESPRESTPNDPPPVTLSVTGVIEEQSRLTPVSVRCSWWSVVLA